MKVAVFGLGYIDTVTATCLAARGRRLVGVEVDQQEVESIGCGRAAADSGR